MSIDDTRRLVSGKDSDSLVVGNTSANEILDLLLLTLKDNPGRTDLWMMRLDILRTAGLKADFASALKEAYASSTLRRNLDWAVISRQWEELSAGAPAPEGVLLPQSATRSGGQAAGKSARRFSDIALQLAGSELDHFSQEYQALRSRPSFFMDFAKGTRAVLKRPTPLHHAHALERELGGSTRLFLKREDMHDSTPETEMAAAHAYIAKSLGRQFIVTGNDVDEFSLALARVSPHFDLKLTVYVGVMDIDTRPDFVKQLQDLGAEVDTLRSGELKTADPREAAVRLWTRMSRTYHLALSFGTGPNPYPRIVSDFQMLLGYETELQLRAHAQKGRSTAWVAAVHSEADSIGFMLPSLTRLDVELFYAEPASDSGRSTWKPSKRLRAYNGAKREHAWLRATERIVHIPISDRQALGMQDSLKRLENIPISLEDARAVSLATELANGSADQRDIVVLVR